MYIHDRIEVHMFEKLLHFFTIALRIEYLCISHTLTLKLYVVWIKIKMIFSVARGTNEKTTFRISIVDLKTVLLISLIVAIITRTI